MYDTNFTGTWYLYVKEVKRFCKVYNQTLIAPMVTSLLFLAIFNLALGHRIDAVGSVPFGEFMAAGLIMMAVMQNAFANTSSSIIMGKVLGVIIDYLIPPISAGEMVFAMVMAGVTRGVFVGLIVGVAIWFFVPIHIYHLGLMLFYIISASMLMAILGLLGGIVSESFDQMSAVTSYIITPLSFLSGTFYSVSRLPEFWYHISLYNPFFYMIDGFRYALTDYHDGNLLVGAIVIIATNAILWIIAQMMVACGYRIKE